MSTFNRNTADHYDHLFFLWKVYHAGWQVSFKKFVFKGNAAGFVIFHLRNFMVSFSCIHSLHPNNSCLLGVAVAAFIAFIGRPMRLACPIFCPAFLGCGCFKIEWWTFCGGWLGHVWHHGGCWTMLMYLSCLTICLPTSKSYRWSK